MSVGCNWLILMARGGGGDPLSYFSYVESPPGFDVLWSFRQRPVRMLGQFPKCFRLISG